MEKSIKGLKVTNLLETEPKATRGLIFAVNHISCCLGMAEKPSQGTQHAAGAEKSILAQCSTSQPALIPGLPNYAQVPT